MFCQITVCKKKFERAFPKKILSPTAVGQILNYIENKYILTIVSVEVF